MATGPTLTQTRERRARAALDALADRAAAERMTVQCHRSHHLAAVYDTAAGPVVRTRPGSHAHGSKDFVDTAHHGSRAPDRLDLLEAGRSADDVLAAWCDCGPVELSRRDLLRRLGAGERRVLVGG